MAQTFLLDASLGRRCRQLRFHGQDPDQEPGRRLILPGGSEEELCTVLDVVPLGKGGGAGEAVLFAYAPGGFVQGSVNALDEIGHWIRLARAQVVMHHQ
jgi:hypothetical protein